MNKQKILSMVMLAVSVIMAVVSFFILPDTVVTQFSIGGSGVTTMPKLAGIAIPFVIGAGGAIVSLAAKENAATRKKSLIVSAVGIGVFCILLAVNCIKL